MKALLDDARAFCIPFYSEPQRAYHTLRHAEAMLNALESRGVLTSALALAVWGHDLIYDPTRSDNEARSAEVFGDWLASQGVSDEMQREVAALILATKHDQPTTSHSASLLVNADLAVFGASDEDFWQYEQNIRREYQFVPWADYQLGRRAVLEQFLTRERLYGTPEFSGLERTARRHLEEAIAALDEPEPFI